MSGLLFLTGGLGNPFAFLLMAPVMVSAAGLSARYTFMLGVLATVCASFLAVFHYPLPWPDTEIFKLPVIYSVGIWIALVLTLGFMAVYAFRVAEEARQLANALTATELVLAREQHLNALDGLATAAAHELGTPLATIYLVAKELTDEFEAQDHRGEDVALIRSQAERCREILKKLTSLSSEEDQTYQRMPVAQLLEDVVDPHRGTGVAIHSTNGGEGAEPVGTRNAAIRYGLGNLVENAVDFAKSRVDVSAQWDENTLSISIRDDGPGFSMDILGKIGTPTYPSAATGPSKTARAAAWDLESLSQKPSWNARVPSCNSRTRPLPRAALISASAGRARCSNDPLEWTKRRFSPITTTKADYWAGFLRNDHPFCARRRKNRR